MAKMRNQQETNNDVGNDNLVSQTGNYVAAYLKSSAAGRPLEENQCEGAIFQGILLKGS